MGRKKKTQDWTSLTQEDVVDRCAQKKFNDRQQRAKSSMDMRTKNHDIFSKISHMQNIYPLSGNEWSEGSTQAIKRKIRAQTIQRVPDGEIVTQFDKNSIEQIEIEFIFKHKILTSEYDGKDMLKNIWRAFNYSYDYGFACVRSGFEKDLDGDIRVSQKLIRYKDIWPAPDCDYIEEAQWYIVREFLSRSELEALIDSNDQLTDTTYDEKVVRYLVNNKYHHDSEDIHGRPLADEKNHVSKTESLEIWTLYERGSDKFETFVPSIGAILRTVDNYDPRKDIPLHFLVLEPDPEFPLGCSSVLWTLAQQQFADCFQSTVYQILPLALNPPLMTYGSLNPSRIDMMPGAVWEMGGSVENNQIVKFPVETSPLNQFSNILQGISSAMQRNLNVTDSTIPSDAKVAGYSATPQGVNMQERDKTITINQYQKRTEVFFSEWANHALRSYINSMGGEQWLTVDEETRRKIYDVESAIEDENYVSIIDGNKIKVEFSNLKDDMYEFQVRSGSLIENRKDEERKNIQAMIVATSQMLPAVSDENKHIFEEAMMRMLSRMFELSDIDIAVANSNPINKNLETAALKATMEEVMQQRQMLEQIMMQQQGAPAQGEETERMAQPGMQPGSQLPQQQTAVPGGAMPPEAAGGQVAGVPTESPLPAGLPVR